jgi:phosphinothricin acetyltransferase
MPIRLATADDLPWIQMICDYYIKNSTCTFDTEPVSLKSWNEWLDVHGERYPATVSVHNDRIVGYGCLRPFHPRPSAWHTVEDSVYVNDTCRGKGVGIRILTDLVERARKLGYHSIVAGIAADQPASLALHAKLGFVEVSRIREVGHKLGVWIDVIQMQKMLR